MAAFLGMHVSPAKDSYAWLPLESVTTGQTHRRTDRQTPDKVIPMCHYHRSQTLLWYNQFNGGYDQFVTAGTISSYGILIWRTKMERIDGKNIVISF